MDGNYHKVRDIIWPRADTLVWLDYPLPVIMWRLFKRGASRVVTREKLWNGNQETLHGLFFSRDSLFIWALKKQWSRRREYPALFRQPQYAHLTIIRLPSPRKTQKWLSSVEGEQ